MARRRGNTWIIVGLIVAVVAAAFIIPELAGHPPAPSIDFVYTASRMSYTFSATLFRYTAPVNYTWTFGDGQQAIGKSGSQSNPTVFNVTHTYGKTGTYSVGLSVVDIYGNTGFISHDVVVTNYVPVSGTLSVAAQGTAATATVTVSGGSSPYYVSFDFGDGAAVGVQKGSGPTIVLTHTYLQSGTFTVSAQVSDSTQSAAVPTNSETVTVEYSGMHATLITTADNMTVNASVSVSGGQAPYSFSYNWGDGSQVTSTSNPSAKHTYTIPGTYTVNVTVYDMSLNAPVKLSSSVTVPPPPPASLQVPMQVLGILLAGIGSIVAVLMLQYSRFRKWRFVFGSVMLIAFGAALIAGVF